MPRFTRLILGVLLLIASAQPCLAGSKPVVFFGINLRYSPRTMYARYQPLMDYLTENTPYRFELLISRDYRQALNDLKDGRVLISSLGDGAFVEAMLLYGAVPIVKPLNHDGKPFYRAAIVVPRDSHAQRITDLKNKRFAFGSHHSITGNLLPRYMLERGGVSVSGLEYRASLKNHDAVTKAILKGQYDAGSVKEVFAGRYWQYGLRVLAFSDPIPSVPLVVRPDIPPPVRDAVVAALLKLDRRNPAHREIMSRWDDEFQHGFAPASATDYREQIWMFQSIPFGCGSGCHR
ncbi:ABC transporter, substrate-binding protein [Citrifermentans bremense]|uniref:ABC transporter, substrate-binding protein n=1 Tax=Citrifermentans bremense TaxID=60035 RepID=A0A6S6M1P3_9BACT|nr:phosphate/phosphite/phosphonate ABC transporter substrate-binding protein [Citrifermentans bremense]BCG45641.1 ABC transporter, substrate-binding protein [Citrifermentans bremense]